MTQLTRRQMLVGTAAAAVASAVPFAAPSPAGAVAPAGGRQVPGFYRYKVGSIEVTVVTDGINRLPIPDGFVLNAKKDEINAALALPRRPHEWPAQDGQFTRLPECGNSGAGA